MTTKEMRDLEIWPKIQEILRLTIADARKMWPGSSVVLVDTGTSYVIEIDGEPTVEIDGETIQ